MLEVAEVVVRGRDVKYVIIRRRRIVVKWPSASAVRVEHRVVRP